VARGEAGLGFHIPRASESGRDDWPRHAGIRLLVAGLAVALAGQGWTVEALPGETVKLRMGQASVDPLQVVTDMADGRMDVPAWERWCRDAAVDVRLAGGGRRGQP
jgi:hypothetical protein